MSKPGDDRPLVHHVASIASTMNITISGSELQ